MSLTTAFALSADEDIAHGHIGALVGQSAADVIAPVRKSSILRSLCIVINSIDINIHQTYTDGGYKFFL